LKRWLKLLVLLVLISLCLSCGSGKGSRKSGPTGPEPVWSYEKDGIHVSFKAAPTLNSFNGLPHTLDICFYQLKDPNVFNQLSGDEQGLYLLMGCTTFDVSVTSFQRITVQPGQDLSLTIDRAEGSRYVALLAGYYKLERDRIIRLESIPVLIKRKLFFTKYAVPGAMNLDVSLGAHQIEKVEVNP
jgi:type VI secretion system VasD/TssJ family lipoprotein